MPTRKLSRTASGASAGGGEEPSSSKVAAAGPVASASAATAVWPGGSSKLSAVGPVASASAATAEHPERMMDDMLEFRHLRMDPALELIHLQGLQAFSRLSCVKCLPSTGIDAAGTTGLSNTIRIPVMSANDWMARDSS